jgi:hypothetical protein
MARIQTQQIDPTKDLANQAQKASANEAQSFDLFTQEITTHKFEEGRHFFRFVPQPAGAENSWYALLPHIYLDPAKVPGYRGYLPLTAKQAKYLGIFRNAAFKDTTIEPTLFKKNECPNGIELVNVKYKNVFLGFDVKVLPHSLSLVTLPSNRPTDKTGGRVQSGTTVAGFMYETDFSGNPKYGNIVDDKTGRMICIEVKGIKDRREYLPSVDGVLDISATKYDDVINKTAAFEKLIAYVPDDKFLEIVKAATPANIWNKISALVRL